MTLIDIKKILLDLTIEPYIHCEITHTLSVNKKQVVSISFDANTNLFKIVDIENGTSTYGKDVESSANIIQQLIVKNE
ncbi:hypothetical protein [Halalkalibacter nanhaiisediminis]|uniref:Uncharacterized protein n=1 Tax=Halalkalibacter nanhaiisediminis TaxID=688079 RepID=A0A562QMF5_9BACI|nr:hypothetical protein [Halalkalibacter nanhaiisediminis]TWI57927.1 hypothetical protein IQ10_01256 [Halalkalibacter nanhaiisediminis]